MKETLKNIIEDNSEDIVGIILVSVIILSLMYLMGRVFESDLKDLEKTNPSYRKYLKDKYNI